MKIKLKLAAKVSLIAIIITTGVILALSVILLMTTASRSLENSTETALSQSKSTALSFTNAMRGQSLTAASAVAVRSMANYLFSQYTDGILPDTNFILIQNNDAVFNRTEYEPALLMSAGQLSASQGMEYITVKAGKQYLFLTRQNIALLGTQYTIYMIKDITGVYSDINWLIMRFILIGGCAVSVCAVLLYLFLKKAFSPIRYLERQTQMISDGIYDKRVEVKSGDEIGSLAENFNHMAEAVEKNIRELTLMARQQKMLLVSLTHEIKTPMTSVIGYSDTLLRTKITDEQKGKAAAIINRECLRIERLTQKMMSLIAAENQAIVLRPQDVRELFRMVSESTENLLSRSGAQLIIEEREGCFAMDLDLMTELLFNLIENAVRADAKRIVLSSKENEICVADNGKGIPENELGRLTQPFYRGDPSRSTKNGGLGLGLAICSKIAEAHHAALKFESTEKKGTTVSLTFTD